MTPEDFIREAKARGMDMNVARAKYEQIKASGGFDESPAASRGPSQDAGPKGLFPTPYADRYQQRTGRTVEETFRDNPPLTPEQRERLKTLRGGLGVIAETQKPKFEAFSAVGMDALTDVLRKIASLPALMPGGETYQEALQRTRGKQIGNIPLSDLPGTILRSPATMTAGLGSGAVAPVLSKIPAVSRPLVAGLAEAIPSAAVGQAERFAETGDVSPTEVGAEVAVGTLLPVLGQAGKSVGRSMFTGMLKPKASTLRRINMTAGDVTKIAEREGLIGDFGDVAKKATSKINTVDNSIENVLDRAEESGVKVNTMKAVSDLMDAFYKVDVKTQKELSPQDYKAAKAMLESTYDAFNTAGQLGTDVDPKKVREMKQFLSSAFNKGPNQQLSVKDKVNALLYFKLSDALGEAVPEIGQLNKEMHDLLALRTVANDAMGRTDNLDRLFGLKSMFAGHIGQSIGGPVGAAIGAAAASVASRQLGRGRGAQATYGLGSMLQQPSKLQPLISQIPNSPEERLRRLNQ